MHRALPSPFSAEPGAGGSLTKTRLLFLATHPKEVASTRYRVLAYQPFLQEAGYEIVFQSFFASETLSGIYAPGKWGEKLRWLYQGWQGREGLLRHLDADLVFIHRELFPLGFLPAIELLERELARAGCRRIFDFDDAVFLPHRQNRGVSRWFENPSSVRQLITRSDSVIAGNRFLAGYARRFNHQVFCIPTPVDTLRYAPLSETRTAQPCVIGWIGSPSTAKYLESLTPVLKKLAQSRRFTLKVIGAAHPIRIPGVEVDQRPWDLVTEAEEFRKCDIGLYPLWDDEWSRGKCGYKALQFMASGVPVVASSIGMNLEILSSETNGFLAADEAAWHSRLTQLMDSPSLRQEMGRAGRQTIEERYSLNHLAPLFLEALEETLSPRKARAAAPPSQEPSAVSVGLKEDILCFSSIDWDFVWQGHQEIMLSLARQGHRVLFIENTGVRGPRFQDVPRIQKRFSKWRRSTQGFWKVEENLYVYSPLILPFPYSAPARWINKRILLSALNRWMRAMNFYQPICWTFLPTPLTLDVLKEIPRKLLIYYCIDSFADSTPAAQRISASEQKLFREANLVFVTSQQLFKQASAYNKNVHLFPFGVSLEAFEKARENPSPMPLPLRTIPRPVVGYVGGLHQWIDEELVLRAARAHPNYSFVFVGPLQSDMNRLQREPNIHLLGQKPHEDIPHYIRCFDVGIIPYRLTRYTENVYPTKLNEYLAMGKPVLSTALAEVESFNQQTGSLVEIARSPAEFLETLPLLLREDDGEARLRRIQAARQNAWGNRFAAMQTLITNHLENKSKFSGQEWKQRLSAEGHARTRFLRWTGTALLLPALVFSPLGWWAARPLRVSSPPQRADAIVVFGGGVGESGQSGESYQERVREAVNLYRSGYAPRIHFVSGFTWIYPETDLMSALAKDLGIPPSALSKETRVARTYDYILRIGETAQREHWGSILLVTSPYHTRRARLTFRKNVPALGVFPMPVKNSSYYAQGWILQPRQLHGILHEYLGILYYRLRGWL